MRIFEIIKENVNLREAAELYGIDVNRYGKALCPFHNDRHPSLYVADDHYYCFACGEHGDVIDFVGRLFQLSPYNAARKLMADFHLSPDKPPSAAALHAKRIRTEAQQLMENERLCFSVLSDYARVLRDWKMRYTPQSPDVPVHAWFVEACHKLDQAEYYLDILCAGDSFERAEVVQQQMAGGKLDRLRQRLEKIHKEEIEDGYIRFRADSEASSKAIYEAYTRWCDDNAQKPMSANRVSSELAQNERLYNVEATNNVHVGGKRVRGFMGIEVVNPLPY